MTHSTGPRLWLINETVEAITELIEDRGLTASEAKHSLQLVDMWVYMGLLEKIGHEDCPTCPAKKSHSLTKKDKRDIHREFIRLAKERKLRGK